MNHIRAHVAGVLVAGSALVVGAGTTAGPASGADGGGKVTSVVGYSCVAQGSAPDDAATVTLSVTLPGTVTAGGSYPVVGSLRISFPGSTATTSQAAAAMKAGLGSTDFALDVSVGGQPLQVQATQVSADLQPIGTPFVVAAAVTFSDLQIPPGTTGEVVVDMPTKAMTPNPLSPPVSVPVAVPALPVAAPVAAPVGTEALIGPDTVVFKGTVAQDSAAVASRDLACWLPDSATGSAPPEVARIAVVAKGGTKTTTPAATTASKTPKTPATPGTAAGGGQAPPAAGGGAVAVPAGVVGAAPAGSSALPPPEDVTAEDVTTADAAPAAVAAGTITDAVAPLSAAIPPTTQRPGTFISMPVLLLMVLMVPALLAGFAGRQRLRLAAARERLRLSVPASEPKG